MRKQRFAWMMILLLLFVYTAYADEETFSATGDFSALAGKRIAVQTGTTGGHLVEANIPNAKIIYYDSQTDCLVALQKNKADAWCSEKPTVQYMMIDNPDLALLDGKLDENEFAAIFPKTEAGQALRNQYSAFAEKLWADGTMQEIHDTWFGSDEEKRDVLDYEALPDFNGTLYMALDSSLVPFAYVKNSRVIGYDVDIAARFCQEYGYRLKIVQLKFDGVLASVQSGKCDFASCGITVTEERAESVLFSSPNYHSGVVLAVLKGNEKDSEQNAGFWKGIRESFNKTFLREDRWMLFLTGVLITLLITVLSALLGTGLGFGAFMMCRKGNRAANAVTRFFMWLVRGMPMVVLLMILYYIIFGKSTINGIAVSVIGFTLTFGASVFGLLKMGVGAVDKGQYEAACALGYSNAQTFFGIILPQALPHVLPSYKGEIISLIKATSIVGYIAVQDLTRMGDIVRSRTYEAFFPLIAVTVIYFALEGLLGFLVGKIEINFDPKRRKAEDILKGLKTDG